MTDIMCIANSEKALALASWGMIGLKMQAHGGPLAEAAETIPGLTHKNGEDGSLAYDDSRVPSLALIAGVTELPYRIVSHERDSVVASGSLQLQGQDGVSATEAVVKALETSGPSRSLSGTTPSRGSKFTF